MKVVSAAIAFLGGCILLSVWILSNTISNTGNNLPSSFYINQPMNEEYELIVNDGWFYLYNKSNGQVWKKSDDSDSYWETVKHYSFF